MSFTRNILSAITFIRSQILLQSDHQITEDASSYTYCWNYRNTEFGDFNVVEIEDLTASIQLDDASLFLSTVEVSGDKLNSQMVF